MVKTQFKKIFVKFLIFFKKSVDTVKTMWYYMDVVTRKRKQHSDL